MKNILNLFILIVVLLLSTYPVYAETQLLWDASNSVVNGYRIYYGTAQGDYQGIEDVGNVTQYSLSYFPLQEETTYYFVAKAYNDAGESDPSNEVQWYCPDSTPPIPPQDLTIQVINTGDVLLNWTANSENDLSGYYIYQGTSSGVYGTPSPLDKTNTYTISGLTLGETYYFVVSAMDDASNESGYSGEVNATIYDMTAPVVAIASPTSESIYDTTSGTITLSGIASDNVDVTTVTWANAANGTSGIAAGTSSWSISGISLTEGVNTLTITASDSADNSASDILTATYTIPDTAAPVITITSPVMRPSYRSIASSVKLAGDASDNVGITKVTWENEANGTSGIALGTTSWSVSRVDLNIGNNPITLTAYDEAGNSSTDQLLINRRR